MSPNLIGQLGLQLASLAGLETFAALGCLVLTGNKITWEELRVLRKMHIVELTLEGNAELTKGLSASEYRQQVIHLLPHVWVLDGKYISQDERQQASESLSRMPIPAEQDAPTSMWEQWENSENADSLLMLLAEQPSKPLLVDRFRLKHLAQHYTKECWRHNEHVAAQRHLACGKKRPGDMKEMPHLHLERLLKLEPKERQDLAVILSISLQFEIPEQIVTESLSILLAGQLDSAVIQSMATLVPFAKATNVFFLHALAMTELAAKADEVDPVDYGAQVERELWDAMPRVSTGIAGNEDSKNLQLRARHAVIILSRSPTFPPLMVPQAAQPLPAQKIYAQLLPVLTAAEMTEGDFTTDGDKSSGIWASGTQAVGKVTLRRQPEQLPWNKEGASFKRSYSRPWDQSFKEPEQDNQAEGMDSGSEFMQTSPAPINLPSFGLKLAEDAEQSSTFYGVRQPAVGDVVEIGVLERYRAFPSVMEANCEGGEFKVSSFLGMDEEPYNGSLFLSIKDVVWQSARNGYWRHRSAFYAADVAAEDEEIVNGASLHRMGQSFSKVGVAQDGVGNIPLRKSDMPIKSEKAGKTLANNLGVFTRNDTWHDTFVIAPPDLIKAQNRQARAFGEEGKWSQLHDAVPRRVDGEVTSEDWVEAPTNLTPSSSVVNTVLAQQIQVLSNSACQLERSK
jgi:hypothetical protein